MVKRVIFGFSAVLILVSVLCFSVFALDGYSQYDVTTVNNFFDSDSLSFYVNDSLNWTGDKIRVSDGNIYFRTAQLPKGVIRTWVISNDGDTSVNLTLHIGGWWKTGDGTNLVSVTISPGGLYSLDLISNYASGIGDGFWVGEDDFSFEKPYSPFDTTPLFPIISSLYTFITGNTVLIVLFFIGVTISLGFVTIRFIRKVMWGN